MATVLDSVPCHDDYQPSTTCGPVVSSNGGYFTIVDNDVYAQLGSKASGVSDVAWGPEVHVPVCNGTLFPDTYAVRFRNYRAGHTATLSAALFAAAQPALTIGAATSVLSGTVNVQHNGALVGTQPTIDFEDSTGGVFAVSADAPGSRIEVSVATAEIDAASLNNQVGAGAFNGVFTALGFGTVYEFNTNTAIFPSRGSPASGMFVAKAGLYEFTGWADLDPAGGAGNQRMLRLAHNGGLLDKGYTRVPPFADQNDMLATAMLVMGVGDYVELNVFQDSGGPLTVNAFSLQAKYLHS